MAEFASVIALASLNGITGFRLDGAKADDRAGFSVSAGDINGDGFSDLIVGAYAFDTGPGGGEFSAGATYVVFGKASGFGSAVELSSLSTTSGFRLDGTTAGDLSGYSVSSAGDVNGDGFDDVIIGAQHADNSAPGAGSSYVVFGKATGFGASLALSGLNGGNGFRLDGVAAYDRAGYLVSGAGDVNGDGFDDLIVGAHFADPSGSRSGTSYVVFGKASGFGPSLNLSTLNGATGFKLTGTAAYDYSGHSVSAAGDVNGDGFSDVIVGAYLADPGGRVGAGTSYVVFGKSAGFASTIAFGGLSGASGFRIEGFDGLAGGEHSGFSVRSAGDVNGDRCDDLIIGAPTADRHGFSSGAAYVVFGKTASFGTGINVSALNGSNGFRLDGIGALDYAGIAVDSAGDVNGDGFDDIIVGAYFDSRNAPNDGTSYVVFGKASGFGSAIDLAGLNGINGFRLDGESAYDRSGRAVATAGDVNGDGFGDIIIGAYKASPGGRSYAGSSYVVFGRMPDSAVNRVGSIADQRILGGNFNDTISGLAGIDTLDGGGGNDSLDGGTGADLMRGGAGNDIYVVNAGGDTIVEGLNQGTDLVRSTVTFTLGANVENLILYGLAPVTGTGNGLANALTGNAVGNVLNGGDGSDTLNGGLGNDRLLGGNGGDRLIGAGGRDTMGGGAGNDVFDFNALAESPVGAQRDVITDFDAGTPTTFVDRIDLFSIDANALAGGNQAFVFIGAAAFAPNTPGRVRYVQTGANTIVALNTDNDIDAEMHILLTGVIPLRAQDFIL